MSKIEPLKDRIIVKRDEVAEKVLESGIILRESDQPRPQEGEVVAIGPEVKDVKKGDRVMFGKNDGATINFDGESLLVLREGMIWGILDE